MTTGEFECKEFEKVCLFNAIIAFNYIEVYTVKSRI